MKLYVVCIVIYKNNVAQKLPYAAYAWVLFYISNIYFIFQIYILYFKYIFYISNINFMK